MRKLMLGLTLVLAGCGSLHEGYVRQDRANYETLAPRVRKMLKTTTEFDAQQKTDIYDRLEAWDASSQAGMDAIKKDGDK